jgi:hypothetical protein
VVPKVMTRSGLKYIFVPFLKKKRFVKKFMPSRELQGHIPLTVEDKYLNILKI